MKPGVLVLFAVAGVAGCTMNGSPPLTSWGKPGITMLDYRTDSGQCALIGATSGYDQNGAKSAGGISGQNSSPPVEGQSGAASASAASAGATPSPGGPPKTIGNTTWRDGASPDFVNRAVTQQQSQEMAAQRARNDALRFCLASRGYIEFALTREQREKLSRLEQGSEERRQYLFALGTDPDVLSKQQVIHNK